MAISTNPLQRDRVLVQAARTGDRLTGPSSNAALMLARSLSDLEPTIHETLTGIVDKDIEKKRAEGHRAALVGQGAVLADAVREGKIAPTQNPWFIEAYNKESGAIRAQSAFTRLQTESTTWEEQNDPAKFAERWNAGVAEIAKGFGDKDSLAGFDPIQRQFTQQVLQSNTAQNQQRIIKERRANVSSLAADALVQAASRGGGTLSAPDAIAALQHSKEMWLATGGTVEEWNTLQTQAITTAAYNSKNPGLLDLTKAIGLDGTAVLDGTFGAAADLAPPTPTPQAPAPVLASHSVPEAFRAPVANARFTDGFGKRRASGEVHNGLDLAVPEGTPVTSPGAGRVIEVGWDKKGGGNYVKVDYGNGLTSSFAHLSRQDVKVGDVVAAGAQVGLSGQTGRAHGAHVHWVVRQGNTAINPMSAKFPQAAAGEKRTSVEEAFADLNAPAPAEPAQGEAGNPPAPPVARGPSLYDIAGTADSLESDRYRITQAQEDALTHGLQVRKAAIEQRAAAATDYLYAQHGTDILLGNYKTPALIHELEAQGYKGPEIQETLRQLAQATSASAEMSSNRMRINDADPRQARAIMELGLEGQRNGWSQAYEDRVGEHVLSGDISGDEGQRMVSQALARTNQQQSEARAQANFERQQEASQPGVIHNYTQLRQRTEDLTGLAMQVYTQKTMRVPSEQERKKAQGIVSDAVRAWLASHPGDFTGALQAGRDAVASYGANIRQPGALLMAPGAGANPRAAH